jgi:MoxR-like ATPase
MPNIRCKNCGLSVLVPAGGRRLCGCGAWLSADGAEKARTDIPVATAAAAEDDDHTEILAELASEAPGLAETAAATGWPRIEGDLSAIERLNDGYRRIRAEMGKAIVGQEKVLEELLIAIFARGHCLLVGVPGLAKTLMIRTLADSLSLSFSRIQFTPDLMPSDITGTEVLQEDKSTGHRLFKFLHGPIFANVILADEINRTPPKTQAALLEAMQERQVTVGGTRHRLPDPFFVLATQNPIEQEGTYPLPEAQQDRFMFNILVDYPEEEEEFKIVERTTSTVLPELDRVLSATDILEMQDIVRKVPVAPYVIRYAMKFTRLTRKARASGHKKEAEVPDFVRDYVTWGAGPRATQFLILAAKARAVLHGRYYVSCEDVRAVAAPVLRHRIVTNFNAEAEGVTPDDLVRRLIDLIPRDPQEKQ